MVQRTMRARRLTPWWLWAITMIACAMERCQDDPELATSIEPNITTGHQDWNSMKLMVATSSTSWSTRDEERLADTTSLRSRRARMAEDPTTSWTSTSRSSWWMMQSTSTCSSWRDRSWLQAQAHDTCDLGFESQGNALSRPN